ncbi:hypothetical protein QBC45DRAFT_414964 [Copromyces sp. CBS 386.78]|nr:hypothetical protein QBC45DRAFT_414964 [Copromyces sp. CBS 386.78]
MGSSLLTVVACLFGCRRCFVITSAPYRRALYDIYMIPSMFHISEIALGCPAKQHLNHAVCIGICCKSGTARQLEAVVPRNLQPTRYNLHLPSATCDLALFV